MLNMNASKKHDIPSCTNKLSLEAQSLWLTGDSLGKMARIHCEEGLQLRFHMSKKQIPPHYLHLEEINPPVLNI